MFFILKKIVYEEQIFFEKLFDYVEGGQQFLLKILWTDDDTYLIANRTHSLFYFKF